MSSNFLVAVFFVALTSLAAKADTSLDSRGPYLIIQSGRVTVHKINKNGDVLVSRYDSSGGKYEFQRIENEVASQSLEKGSFKSSDSKAIVDWASLKDGYTYGTMFGPPGEELFVMENSKFKSRGNPDYETFKSLCDKVSFVPAGR